MLIMSPFSTDDRRLTEGVKFIGSYQIHSQIHMKTKAFFSPGRTGRRSNMNMLYLLNKLYYKYLMNLNNEKEKMEKQIAHLPF